MLFITAPAKTFNTTSVYPQVPVSTPAFLHKTAALHTYLRTLNVLALQNMMHVSEDLAVLNVKRYQTWQESHTTKNSRPSIFMFAGDVFKAMHIADYTLKQLDFANAHVRILSGFYGVLKPFDLMQPYRLEMGTQLPNGTTNKLPDYWQDSVTKLLYTELQNHDCKVLINLASKEYSAAIDEQALVYPMVHVTFLQERAGGIKTYGILAKQARGMMLDYCIVNGVNQVDDLEKFTSGGYKLIHRNEKEFTFLLPKQGK